jgi:hypothetical protein
VQDGGIDKGSDNEFRVAGEALDSAEQRLVALVIIDSPFKCVQAGILEQAECNAVSSAKA